jgi:hypothetical protein
MRRSKLAGAISAATRRVRGGEGQDVLRERELLGVHEHT